MESGVLRQYSSAQLINSPLKSGVNVCSMFGTQTLGFHYKGHIIANKKFICQPRSEGKPHRIAMSPAVKHFVVKVLIPMLTHGHSPETFSSLFT
jgi:hypothetical protein